MLFRQQPTEPGTASADPFYFGFSKIGRSRFATSTANQRVGSTGMIPVSAGRGLSSLGCRTSSSSRSAGCELAR